MQVINYYEKDGHSPSITQFKGHWDNDTREKVMDYLLAYEHYVATKMGDGLVNGFTGSYLEESCTLFSDGTYEWTGDLPFYVRHFNVALPQDFISRVLKNTRPITPIFDWKHQTHPYPKLAILAMEMSRQQSAKKG